MRSYDVLIIGGGCAGLSCSICLSKNGISNLVLEQKKDLSVKTCGDGLTVAALRALRELNIDVMSLPGKKVNSKIIYRNNEKEEILFSDLYGEEYEYGLFNGILRKSLLDAALKNGSEIVYGHTCRKISRRDNLYNIDDKYYGHHVVIACGALGLMSAGGIMPKNLPIGMSARITGKCSLSDTSFHYFFEESYGNGYAWVFPIGENTWNVGVYGCMPKMIKELYYRHEKNIFGNEDIKYVVSPAAAFVGASKKLIIRNSSYIFIGDSACSADFDSGEGISFALYDGMNAAQNLTDEIHQVENINSGT